MPLRKAVSNRVYGPHVARHCRTQLFEAVYLELRTRCNGSCGFCAASARNDTRPDQVMAFELFTQIIDQLKEIGFTGKVAFHVNNDPLIVPEVERYAAYVHDNLPAAWLQILTNGRALKNGIGERLIAAGINELSVNWYDSGADAPLPAHLVEFRDKVLPSLFPNGNYAPGLGPFPDRDLFRFNLFRRNVDDRLTNRGGTAPNKARLAGRSSLGFCVYPFTQLNITADGRVSKCCADVPFDEVMGDLRHERLVDIWYGAKFEALRRNLRANRRGVSAQCSCCDFLGIRASKPIRWIEQVGFRMADCLDHEH